MPDQAFSLPRENHAAYNRWQLSLIFDVPSEFWNSQEPAFGQPNLVPYATRIPRKVSSVSQFCKGQSSIQKTKKAFFYLHPQSKRQREDPRHFLATIPWKMGSHLFKSSSLAKIRRRLLAIRGIMILNMVIVPESQISEISPSPLKVCWFEKPKQCLGALPNQPSKTLVLVRCCAEVKLTGNTGAWGCPRWGISQLLSW